MSEILTNGNAMVAVNNDGVVENEFSLSTPAQVAEQVDGVDYIVDLTSRQTSYCSMVADNEDDQAVLFNAMNNPAKRLSDCINEVIRVKHVFVEVVTCEKKDANGNPTGVKDRCPRIVLIDDHGVGYQCVSIGVFSALKKLFQVYGEPMQWKSSIPLKVVQVTKGERKMLTLNTISAKAK